jgi:hypothetical protein
MSSDRELPELAAKAAAYSVDFSDRMSMACDDGVYFTHNSDTNRWWNPLLDDGDALRLAVKLNMRLSIGVAGCMVQIEIWDNGRFVQERWMPIERHEGGDVAAATRRAIVRAAAEIGRTMS